MKMTNELVKPNDFNMAIGQVSSIQQLATILLKTPHFKKMGEEGIYSILFACQSLGVDPFQGLNGAFYYLQGKVGMSTELMASLIRRAGHSVQQNENNNEKVCIIYGKRKDTGDSQTVSFTWGDATTAGLATKDIWKKYPKVMLYNRAMAILARQLFPDVIKGYGYSEDEIKEIADSKATLDVKPIDNQDKLTPKYPDNQPDSPTWTPDVKPLDNTQSGTKCNQLEEPVKPEEATKESIEKLESLIVQYEPKIRDKFDALWARNIEMNGCTTKRFVELQTEAVLRYIGERDANS